MNRLEITVRFLSGHMSRTNAGIITDETMETAMDFADRLIQLDSLRSNKIAKAARDAEAEMHRIIAKPLSTGVPTGGFTPYRKKPNWFERLFSGGGK